MVYGNNRQYKDKAALTSSIMENWLNISLETLKALTSSMPHRLLAVIKNKGGSTKY